MGPKGQPQHAVEESVGGHAGQPDRIAASARRCSGYVGSRAVAALAITFAACSAATPSW